ncbi:MAG: thiol reductant ABC exporter subunit CydC [Spirochaetales bacterium]
MNARLAELKPFAVRMLDFRKHLAGGLGLGLATQISGLALLGVSGWFLTGCGLAGVSAALAEAYDLISPSGAIRSLALGRTGFRWAERVVTHDATFRLIGSLRVWLYDKLAQLSPRQTGSLHAGEMLGRLTKDIDSLDNLYQKLVVPVASAFLLVTAATVFAAVLSPGFALPLLALMATSFLVLPLVSWAAGRRLSPELVRGHGRLRRVLLDTLDSLDDLALHGPARTRQNQVVATCDQERLSLTARQQRLSSGFKALTGLVTGLVAWVLLGLAALLPPGLQIDGPLLVGLVLVVPGLAEFLGALPAVWLELPGTAEAAGRLNRLTSQTPNPAYVEASAQTSEGTRPTQVGTDLQLTGVSFAYDAEPVLSDLTLTLAAGQHVVLSGPSGGGKTTLVRLLTRLEDPTAGTITLGGTDLRQLDETTLRLAIACASQDTYLFTDSLAGNLRLARDEASDDELWEVLTVVGLAETIRAWPEALATWIDEGGESLSGGQRRRLGVARALLRRSPVTILDEPTEGLDDEAGEALVRSVRLYLTGKTLVWVSHRLTDRAGFERQLTLENGVLSEKNHGTLKTP